MDVLFSPGETEFHYRVNICRAQGEELSVASWRCFSVGVLSLPYRDALVQLGQSDKVYLEGNGIELWGLCPAYGTLFWCMGECSNFADVFWIKITPLN